MLLPEGGVYKDGRPMAPFGIVLSALIVVDAGYGLFFIAVAFLALALDVVRCIGLFPPLESGSEDELLRFARRFIQFAKGRRFECLSDRDVSSRPVGNMGELLQIHGRSSCLPCGLAIASAVAMANDCLETERALLI